MTMPPEEVQVECPSCHFVFNTFYRGSINLAMDDFDEDYIEEMSTAVCPKCKCKFDLGSLIVDKDGTWSV